MDHGKAQQLHHHVEEAADGRLIAHGRARLSASVADPSSPPLTPSSSRLGRVLVGEVRLALAHRHDDVHRVDEEEEDACETQDN